MWVLACGSKVADVLLLLAFAPQGEKPATVE
jgi:hypothetical protein